MSNEKTNQTCKLISAKELSKVLSTSVRTIWRWRSAQRLPEPVAISKGTIRWKLSEIHLFIEECDCCIDRFNARKKTKR